MGCSVGKYALAGHLQDSVFLKLINEDNKSNKAESEEKNERTCRVHIQLKINNGTISESDAG